MIEIMYLGHIIGAQGVLVHHENIHAVLNWQTPRTLIELRRFFDLCSFYKRFVKGFSQMGAPLTDLTKKGAFNWTEESQKAFDRMKEVMSTCPLLSLPDFNQSFVLECDVSGKGIGVLMFVPLL
jgi:hypothetical protein